MRRWVRPSAGNPRRDLTGILPWARQRHLTARKCSRFPGGFPISKPSAILWGVDPMKKKRQLFQGPALPISRIESRVAAQLPCGGGRNVGPASPSPAWAPSRARAGRTDARPAGHSHLAPRRTPEGVRTA